MALGSRQWLLGLLLACFFILLRRGATYEPREAPSLRPTPHHSTTWTPSTAAATLAETRRSSYCVGGSGWEMLLNKERTRGSPLAHSHTQ